jgi:predicted thioesterase
MKASLIPGLEKTRRIVVESERVVRHLGEGLGVYGTPWLVADIERLCHAVILEHLDEGEGSVGTRVDIQHLAATPEGMWVDITARVTGVDRRAVTFEVTARDALDEVARCTHNRFVVDASKIGERLSAKISKARQQAGDR